MLSKQNLLRSTLCTILFIAVTNTTPVDIQGLTFDPMSYPPDAYPQDEYVDPVNIYEYAYTKTKRQTTNVLKHEGVDLLPESRLPLTSQKLRELLNILKKPKKSGIFTLNGWSASGMPFNVLYSPNTLQQKFLAAVNVMAGKKESVLVPRPQPLQEKYMEERKEDMRGPVPKSSNKSPQIRRHYLLIPQLFVSYGWGSVGK